jgi:hypothetical protein
MGRFHKEDSIKILYNPNKLEISAKHLSIFTNIVIV